MAPPKLRGAADEPEPESDVGTAEISDGTSKLSDEPLDRVSPSGLVVPLAAVVPLLLLPPHALKPTANARGAIQAQGIMRLLPLFFISRYLLVAAGTCWRTAPAINLKPEFFKTDRNAPSGVSSLRVITVV
jgi:hypothetical protein